MIALQIKNTKSIMNTLLASEQFDAFLVDEAFITTFNTFHIDGHIVKDFFNSEEITNMEQGLPEFSLWKDIRPICFQLIKGKKTPVSFRVILHASPALITSLAAQPDCEVDANLIRSLVLNIRYDNGHVTCVTGTSFTTFLMDKTTDAVWDKYIRQFFANMQIDFEEV